MGVIGTPRAKDISGQRFGRLVVLRRNGRASHGAAAWLCRCDCGREVTVSAPSLRQGDTKSCGCYHSERVIESHATHRMSNSQMYKTWRTMKARCENPAATGYSRYGGRGIYVCERWQSFQNFYADMGDAPPGMTLERIDNDGPYCPENVRWASRKEQVRNTRRTVLVAHNGQTRTLSEWCEDLGIDRHLAYDRLKRGWASERVFANPPPRRMVRR